MGSENMFPPKTEIDYYIEMLEDHKDFYLTYDRLRNYLIRKKLITEFGEVLRWK